MRLPKSLFREIIPNMGITSTDNRALADHLRELRMQRRLTLEQLAASSGISRASLSRIEKAEVSPTAETLGRLAAAHGLAISRLLAPLEPDFPALVRRPDQSVWTDPAAGFTRRMLSPPSAQLKIEMIDCEIAPHRRIAYDRQSIPGHEHHLVLLAGALRLTVDDVAHDLRPGDCLRYRPIRASMFETGKQPARYMIAMS